MLCHVDASYIWITWIQVAGLDAVLYVFNWHSNPCVGSCQLLHLKRAGFGLSFIRSMTVTNGEQFATYIPEKCHKYTRQFLQSIHIICWGFKNALICINWSRSFTTSLVVMLYLKSLFFGRNMRSERPSNDVWTAVIQNIR